MPLQSNTPHWSHWVTVSSFYKCYWKKAWSTKAIFTLTGWFCNHWCLHNLSCAMTPLTPQRKTKALSARWRRKRWKQEKTPWLLQLILLVVLCNVRSRAKAPVVQFLDEEFNYPFYVSFQGCSCWGPSRKRRPPTRQKATDSRLQGHKIYWIVSIIFFL